jgi:hypothetical protein
MSEGAHTQQPKRPARKSAKQGGPARTTPKSQPAAFREDKSVRTSASPVPEIAPSAKATSRRVSAWRIGLLGTLTVIVGAFAWFTEGSEFSALDPSRIVGTSSSERWSDPLGPKVRAEIEHDLQLATLALDIREGQERLSRLWDDARALSARVATLASSLDRLKAGEVARVEERIQRAVSAASGDAVDLSYVVERDLDLMTRLDRVEAQVAGLQIGLASQPTMTGALPDASPAGAAPSQPKRRAGSLRMLKGWHVHSVVDDRALVEGHGQHYEARLGDLLPEAGVVKQIKKRGDEWVVLTSKGIIAEPK